MPISINGAMMRQIIMDHYEHPHNKREPSDLTGYIKIHMDSASCIDDIYVYLKEENDKIVDVCFNGIACTIATASTSIMTELVMGKSKKEAYYIIEQYQNMINEREFDDEVLDEAIVFINTSKQASRIKCATIGWRGLKNLLDGKEVEE